tara:strand:+ start:4349 stop:4591 length:243 start_codon:yes stop_codon:yes gene_type:complete
MAKKRKILYWEGSSKKDFKAFPIDVQKDMGVALFIAQLGGTPDSAKTWKGLGSGVYELEMLYMCYMRSRRSPSLAWLRRV